jgi:hypothetical protein
MELYRVETHGDSVENIGSKEVIDVRVLNSNAEVIVIDEYICEYTYHICGKTWKIAIFTNCKIGRDIAVEDEILQEIHLDKFTRENLGGTIYASNGRVLKVIL